MNLFVFHARCVLRGGVRKRNDRPSSVRAKIRDGTECIWNRQDLDFIRQQPTQRCHHHDLFAIYCDIWSPFGPIGNSFEPTGLWAAFAWHRRTLSTVINWNHTSYYQSVWLLLNYIIWWRTSLNIYFKPMKAEKNIEKELTIEQCFINNHCTLTWRHLATSSAP